MLTQQEIDSMSEALRAQGLTWNQTNFAVSLVCIESSRLQAQVGALAVALQNTLHELWSDRHSHQDEAGFRNDFADEYATLAAAGR